MVFPGREAEAECLGSQWKSVQAARQAESKEEVTESMKSKWQELVHKKAHGAEAAENKLLGPRHLAA